MAYTLRVTATRAAASKWRGRIELLDPELETVKWSKGMDNDHETESEALADALVYFNQHVAGPLSGFGQRVIETLIKTAPREK